MSIIIKEYLDVKGGSPFAKWFNRLKPETAAKVTMYLYRLEQGNDSNVKYLSAGVYEYKLHYGPGYRIYFGKEGKTLIILLKGGTKKQQGQDIEKAKALWKEYKTRKRQLN